MKDRLENYTHFMMSMIGGFFGGFAILNFCNAFGNAQTVNMINIITDIVIGNNFYSALLRIVGIAVYFSGFALSVILSKYGHVNRKYLTLLFHLTAIILLALMPENLDNMIYILPLFFVMSFQWSVFSGAGGYNASTIFSSNNFRQFSVSLTEYICTKDKKILSKTKFYAKTLLSYYTGVLFSAIGTLIYGKRSLFLLILPIIAVAMLIYKQEKNH